MFFARRISKNKMTFSCFIEKLFDKWYFRLINKKLWVIAWPNVKRKFKVKVEDFTGIGFGGVNCKSRFFGVISFEVRSILSGLGVAIEELAILKISKPTSLQSSYQIYNSNMQFPVLPNQFYLPKKP